MNKLFAAIIAVSLCSCRASLTTSRSPHDKYAPVNEVRGGTVKYLAKNGWNTAQARRKDAYKKMAQHCDGPYRITGENIVTENDGGYVHIDFVCEDHLTSHPSANAN